MTIVRSLAPALFDLLTTTARKARSRSSHRRLAMPDFACTLGLGFSRSSDSVTPVCTRPKLAAGRYSVGYILRENGCDRYLCEYTSAHMMNPH